MDFRAIGRRALETARRDIPRAIQVLLKEARINEDLETHLLELGAAQLLRNSLGQDRRVQSEEPSSQWVRPELPHEAAAKARAFMDRYTLFGGVVLLGNATAADLAKSAREHDAQARGHQKTAAFEREVGKRLPPGKRVRDVFNDERLLALKKHLLR